MAQELIDKIQAQAQARGLDPAVALRIAQIESSMNPSAKAKTSSAGGLFQIVDKTWKEYGGKPGQKNNPDENIRVGLNILEANTKSLRGALGRDPSPSELYAAHFLGAQGARTLLTANPDTPVEQLLSARAIKANSSMLQGKNAGQLIGVFEQKMGMPVQAQAAAKPTPAAPMPASAAGAPKRVAEAPAAAPVVASAEAVAPVAPKAADMGAGYQAALALSFLGDEEDKAEKDEGSSAAKMMAAYKPYNALKDFDLGPSIFAQLPLTPGQAPQPQQPKMMADGGEVKERPQDIPEEPMVRRVLNADRRQTESGSIETMLAGANIGDALLAINASKNTTAEKEQMAASLLAAYNARVGDMGLGASVVRPLDAPPGMYIGNLNASYPVGPGRVSVGTSGMRFPGGDGQHTGKSVSYFMPLAGGEAGVSVFQPKGGAGPSGQFSYRARFADGGEVAEPGLLSVPGYSEMVARDMYPGQQGQFDQQDAARHMLASGTLARKYGAGPAEFLGHAHEVVTSPFRWMGSKLGISQMPVDYEQDLHNNRLGIELARRSKSQKDLEDLVQAEAERAAKEQTGGKAWVGRPQRPVKRQEGSPETGEVAGPTPEELEAASRPAFLTPKSGIGRKQSMTSGQVNDAVLAGVQQTPYNLLGAPVDLTALAMMPFGYSNPTPMMGSEWLKAQATRAGIRPATPTQPTARALYEMGQFGAGLVNPAAPVRGAVAAGQAGTRAARDLMQDFQSYNRQLAAPGASYAVKPKGGEFALERPYRDKTGATLVHPVDRYLSTSDFDVQGDAVLETWVNEKLGRYMRRDMASPDDQFVKAADEGKPLHFMQDGQPMGGPSFSSLPYSRKSEGFNPQGEARTPYGKRVEEQIDSTVEPTQLQDFEGSEYRLSPALQSEIKTNPEKRVYQLFGEEVTDRLQFPSMVDAMHTVRHGNGMFKAYGQSVPIPKEFQFSDETLKGLSPAQASERLARYISWSDSARQKAASIALTKNSRISTTKMEGGYTWAEIPDTEANPEILDLVKDVGCAGGWCTEQPSYALEYGSGQNRLHLLVDNKANPKVQLTVKQFEPNIQDFLAQLDDYEYERLSKLADPNFYVWVDWNNPARVAALKQLPEYKSWAARNPPGASISEIKGPANEINLKNSPALRATQDYVKKLDAKNSLTFVANMDGVNMVDMYQPLQNIRGMALERLKLYQPSATQLPDGTYYAFERALREKNQGSLLADKGDVSRLFNEALDEVIGPIKKATGGMVERRTDAAQNYL